MGFDDQRFARVLLADHVREFDDRIENASAARSIPVQLPEGANATARTVTLVGDNGTFSFNMTLTGNASSVDATRVLDRRQTDMVVAFGPIAADARYVMSANSSKLVLPSADRERILSLAQRTGHQGLSEAMLHENAWLALRDVVPTSLDAPRYTVTEKEYLSDQGIVEYRLTRVPRWQRIEDGPRAVRERVEPVSNLSHEESRLFYVAKATDGRVEVPPEGWTRDYPEVLEDFPRYVRYDKVCQCSSGSPGVP